ncbi:MAG: type II secretion system secretin GspD [Pseudomarimonas sp.]
MNHRFSILIVVALAVLLGGCATGGPPAARIYTDYSEDAPVVGDAVANGAEFSVEDGPQEQESDPSDLTHVGTGKLINEAAARKPTSPEGATGEVTFNFEGESLHAVVKLILGEFLQQNYVIAPGVQGTVTFSTARPLRGDQALSILEMLLRWNNATLIWEDGRYTVLPVAQALPGNLTPRVGPAQTARGYEVRAVPLKFISATEMEKLLKPYARPESVVNVDPTRNLITLAGTRAELENYLQTIEVFDVDWLAGMSVGVFTLQQSDAAEVITEMEKIFGEGSNTPLAGLFRFVPLEGINGVLVITPQPDYLTTIEEWLERFDLGGGEAGQRLYVYEVKNVNALDLSDTLSDIFQTSGGRPASSSGAGVAPGLEPVEIRTLGADGTQRSTAQDERKARTEERRAARAEAGANGGGAGGDGISLGAADEVRISAVEESNSLIVRASSSQWDSIRRVIQRLDQVPLQVVIETQIVRVALNESLKYGVQWFFEGAIADQALRTRAATQRGFNDLSGSINPPTDDGPGSLAWSFLGPNAQALITAVDAVSDVTVLSAPSLVVLNNKQGTINVGTQIPVVSTFINNNIGGGGTDPNGNVGTSSVQFRQTGITLSVTPRVNPGGLVFLEIEQEDSGQGVGEAVGGNVPIDTRTIQTEVAVQSGNTVVLGGLIKEEKSAGSSGVPFLNRIPVLGALFGGRSVSGNRDELIVLITPRVIRNADDARQITDEYQRRFRGLKPIAASPADVEK